MLNAIPGISVQKKKWIASFSWVSGFLIVLKWIFCKLKMQYTWIRRIVLSCFLGPWSREITISTAKAPTAALTQSKRLVSRCRRGGNRPRMKQVVIMLGSVLLLFENCSKSREGGLGLLKHNNPPALTLSDNTNGDFLISFYWLSTKGQRVKYRFWLPQTSNRKTLLQHFCQYGRPMNIKACAYQVSKVEEQQVIPIVV